MDIMKLYATITSERASKGQGGNNFVLFNLRNNDKEIILSIRIANTIDKFPLSSIRIGGKQEILNSISEKIKGKRQKGEHCEHNPLMVCEICRNK